MKEQITDYLIKEGFELVDAPDNSKEYFMFEKPKNDAGFDDVIVNYPMSTVFQLNSLNKSYDEIIEVLNNMRIYLKVKSLYTKRITDSLLHIQIIEL